MESNVSLTARDTAQWSAVEGANMGRVLDFVTGKPQHSATFDGDSLVAHYPRSRGGTSKHGSFQSETYIKDRHEVSSKYKNPADQ